jgi:hypothetical protein
MTGCVTLCPVVLDKEDIPRFKISSHTELQEKIVHFLDFEVDTEGNKPQVMVCFQWWKRGELLNWNDECGRILITHMKENILLDEMRYLKDISIENVQYSIFVFRSYAEALKWTTDVKEGF